MTFRVHRVSGSCGKKIANTDWASCLPGPECPSNFLKLDDDEQCSQFGAGFVCCLIRPTFNINVKDAPCIIKGVDSGSKDKEL
ncbi:hypothetical protein AC249_AIPGENE27257 [Exaiptasia diaphana]|nr:hypothetical protein AC249_AIPGENE27257 [Exaiptasia diaphana]